jgi:hypothetical protein
MMWFRKLRQSFISAIATETVRQIENNRPFREFLPPVAFRDAVYLMTKDGMVYRMQFDHQSNTEIFTQITDMRH